MLTLYVWYTMILFVLFEESCEDNNIKIDEWYLYWILLYSGGVKYEEHDDYCTITKMW